VFLIGTPKAAVADYLKLVAGLSRLLKKPGVRPGLLAAKTAAEFLALLARGAESKR
jgi:mannitol/fructose-specific phosphotransferase system IIA component (Ntr-type)